LAQEKEKHKRNDHHPGEPAGGKHRIQAESFRDRAVFLNELFETSGKYW
jgi:hypothetical protein